MSRHPLPRRRTAPSPTAPSATSTSTEGPTAAPASGGRPRMALPLTALAAVTALALGACSAVTPTTGSDSGGSGTAGAAAGPGGDTFGEPVSADQVKQGGTLVMALSAEPDQLDPALSRSLYSRYVFHVMCQKLRHPGPLRPDHPLARR